ncbi:MAG: hypothetical protein ACKOW9_06145 [Candidatus Paceibacterota bacterium]
MSEEDVKESVNPTLEEVDEREAKKQLLEARKKEAEAKKLAKETEKKSRKEKKSEGSGENVDKKGRFTLRKDSADVEKEKIASTLKQSSEGAALLNRREIPIAGFDLLNGAFKTSARMRFISIVIVTALLGAELLLAGLGFNASLQKNATENSIEEIRKERITVVAAFGDATGIKGATETDIIERERELTKAVRTLALSQPDIATLYTELKALDGLGVTVSSITASRPSEEKRLVNANNDGPVKKAPPGVVITIQAQGLDFAQVVSWSKRVQEITQLTDIVSERQGLKITVTAKLNTKYIPLTGADLLASFGIPATIEETATPKNDNTTSQPEGSTDINKESGDGA